MSNELSTTLDETLDRLREFTLRQLNTRDATIVVLSGALLVYILFFCWIPTIEGPHFDLIVKAAFIASLGLLLELFLRVRLASAGFQAFLDTLEEHAVAPAFGIIPERFKRRASLYYLSPSIPKAERDELNASKERLSTAFVATEKPVTQRNQQLPSRVVQSRRIDKERGHLYDESLVVTLDRMLKNRVWNRRVPLPLAEHERYQFNANVWDLENWSTEAQRFLAMRLSLVIRDVFVQLRNLLIALVVLLLLFVWLLHSYPFRPQSLLTIFSYGVVLYVVITLALRFAAFNRNGVLSMMAGTEGNRLSWDRSFIVPMLIYVVVPLLGLLALQFPTLGSVLSDWATDLQQAFKN